MSSQASNERLYGEDGTLMDLLRARSRRASAAAAICAPGRRDLTYRGLLAQVESVSDFLNARGLGRGARIALMLPNGPEMAAAFLGVSAGAICAPLNPAYTRSELEFYLGDLNPKALIVQSGLNPVAAAVAREHAIPVWELLPELGAPAGSFKLSSDEEPSCKAGGGAPPAEDIALLLHTSGTTSRAKLVPLTHANLLASARNIAATLGLVEEDRCLNVMPLFHIHGLVGALLSSLMVGASVIGTAGFDAARFLSWLETLFPSWYTAVPTIHQAVLSSAQAARRPIRHALRLIRSSSSALPPGVMEGLEEAFRVPVVETYGMTEAAHQITSNPLPPRRRKPGSVGVAAGPAVAVMDELGGQLPAGAVGEIVVQGVNVTAGYLDGTVPNRESFAGVWLKTGDQGYIDADGYLFLTGRLKELINRGGEKVAPREVEEALLQHPAVAEAIAFGLPHKTLGEDVVAATVLREGRLVTEPELQQFVAGRLAKFKIPQRVLFVEEIPKGPSGKPQRRALQQKFHALLLEQAMHDYTPPRNRTEDLLASIWSQLLGVERVGVRDNFFFLGGDSLRATQLISRVRDATQFELSYLDIFETPTVEGLARCIERAQPAENRVSVSRPRRSHKSAPIQFSFAQQRLWFVEQLDPGTPIHNRPMLLRLTGKLERAALERSLNEIVRRHETLRMSFPALEGKPTPIVAAAVSLPLVVIHVDDIPTAEGEAEALRRARLESQQPFDLTAGPLVRARLFRLAAEQHVLLLLTHHVVSDGWSDAVLLRELAELYRAFCAGDASPLRELAVQYSDYARWQQSDAEEHRRAEDLSYWKKRLSNAPLLLNLPTDRSRPAIESHRGARLIFSLPEILTDRLKDLSRRENVTLFMTLYAAFAALLHRYTGQDDFLIGVPVSGRGRVETEDLIGVFINTLVLRAELSNDMTVSDLLRRVRATALDAYAHQDLPFEKLVNALRLDRDPSRTPLFQVMFQLRNLPPWEARLSDLEVEPIRLDTGVARFDLSVEIIDHGETLECEFEYKSDLFDAATIRRLAAHFQNLLESLNGNLDRRVSDLPLLTAVERHQLLVEFNNTKTAPAFTGCLQQLFEIVVERTPTALAVVADNRRLTYRQLNRRANQLAHYLRGLGVGPESLVGVCIEPSLDMAVGLLGALKAGGAYVPLDPAYPKERLELMLQDAGVTVLLSQRHLAEDLSDHNRRVVCVDVDWQGIAQESEENPLSGASADNLAYVIYTSGSTGRPKGVAVPHGAVVNALAHIQEQLRLGDRDALLSVASLSFDVSVLEFFLPLTTGAAVVLVSRDAAADGPRLARMLSESNATVMHGTPATWRLLLQAGWRGSARLRILCGGETLEPELAERLSAGGSPIWNLYGPTETTIYSSAEGCLRGSKGRTVSIGKPIANTRIYLLDQRLQPVPVGVTGELCIAGAGLSRGYQNRPDLTAEKFIASPFCGGAGERLYRTGDLARYLPDGRIEYLGRVDHQVKIRGYRIECGDVEAAMRQHPAVREAVVIARQESPGASQPMGNASQLVAYMVRAEISTPSTHELRAFLKRKLPGYMLPAAFVWLDSFPLTPNGKLDRAALPDPHRQIESDSIFVAPRTAVEKTVAQIWAEVLGVDSISIYDKFFELGGHSLRAAQVVSRLQQVFQVALPVRALFDQQTVYDLAKAITCLEDEASISVIAETLLDIESLSEEEARALVDKEKTRG